MPELQRQVRLDEAFERIEETILPCIGMMLDTLLDASEAVPETERRYLVVDAIDGRVHYAETSKLPAGHVPEPGEHLERGPFYPRAGRQPFARGPGACGQSGK